MIHAYDEILLNTACESLGRMLDYSAHSLHIDSDSMLRLFVASSLSEEFERGEIGIIAGMSGIELAYEVLEKSGIDYERRSQRHTIALSSEYHSGFALAYLQWKLNLRFENIISVLNISELINSYQKQKTAVLDKLPWDAAESEKDVALESLNESFKQSILKEYIDMRLGKDETTSELKKIRIKNCLSQSDLAKASSVPLRTIQQYEQRQKDINRARAEYLIKLSSALNCEPALLLQKDYSDF